MSQPGCPYKNAEIRAGVGIINGKKGDRIQPMTEEDILFDNRPRRRPGQPQPPDQQGRSRGPQAPTPPPPNNNKNRHLCPTCHSLIKLDDGRRTCGCQAVANRQKCGQAHSVPGQPTRRAPERHTLHQRPGGTPEQRDRPGHQRSTGAHTEHRHSGTTGRYELGRIGGTRQRQQHRRGRRTPENRGGDAKTRGHTVAGRRLGRNGSFQRLHPTTIATQSTTGPTTEPEARAKSAARR